MNIKSVRFPSPLAVIKGEAHVEWAPGKRGVKEIRVHVGDQPSTPTTGFDLEFITDSGDVLVVNRVPGTVVCVEPPELMPASTVARGLATQVSMQMEANTRNPNGPTSGKTSEEPPPARPIPKSGRVQR
jgi:hypothetical protein